MQDNHTSTRGETSAGRRLFVGALLALAAFLLLLLAGLLTVPAEAQTTDTDPITGETVKFTRNPADNTKITGATIDVSEFESCDVANDATITVEDGSTPPIPGTATNGTAGTEIRPEGDEIVIESSAADGIAGFENLGGDSGTVTASTSITCESADDEEEDGDVIDDRDKTNVCNQVVNIILRDVQNPDVDNNQSATASVTATQSADSSANVATGTVTTGDSSNEVAVEVSNEQIVDIAQELNVSPVIVQQCIQQLGDNNNVGDNDGDNNNNGNGSDNGDNGNGGNSGTQTSTQTATGQGVLAGTIPNKQLPNTGGSLLRNELFYGLLLVPFVLCGGALLIYSLKRG